MAADEAMVEDVGGEDAPPKKKRGRMVMFGVIGTIMLVEAVVIFVLVKSFSGAGPEAVQAQGPDGLDPAAGQPVPKMIELEVVKLRAVNEKAQRPVIYELTVFAVLGDNNKDKVQEILDRRRETIKDRFTRLVRAADPARFGEPDLATLRTLFRSELESLVEEKDVITEVLIPSLIPYGDF